MRLLSISLVALALASAPVLSERRGGDAAAGALLFRQKCQMCHVNSRGAAPTLAPNLAGVVGRKAGTAKPFAYSDQLTRSNLVWTPSMLDRYLSNPTGLVPGTRMITRVPGAADRQNVIAYLSTHR